MSFSNTPNRLTGNAPSVRRIGRLSLTLLQRQRSQIDRLCRRIVRRRRHDEAMILQPACAIPLKEILSESAIVARGHVVDAELAVAVHGGREVGARRAVSDPRRDLTVMRAKFQRTLPGNPSGGRSLPTTGRPVPPRSM